MNKVDYPKFPTALLDTNILTQFTKAKGESPYGSLFEYLKQYEFDIVSLDASLFELVGFTGNKNQYNYLKQWISQLPIISVRREDVESATLLSAYYKLLDPNVHSKQISYCDCLYASQLLRFKERLYIITADIHDYPVSLFDIKDTMVIDDGKKATVVGVIGYSEEKIERAKSKFDLSGKSSFT